MNDDAAPYLPELTEHLRLRLRTCGSVEATTDVFDETMMERVPQAKTLDDVVRAGVEAIVASQGQEPIGALACRLGLSERQFQRRFREAVGVTAKQFARIRRLRSSVANVLQTELDAWGQVAAERGFADQAHLIREFSQLIGLTPTTYQQRLGAIKHVNVTP